MHLIPFSQDKTSYTTTHEVEILDYIVRVIVFQNTACQREITIEDTITGITHISDEDYGCPGAALLDGLKWVEDNI